MRTNPLELLAPAKNAAIGMEAILHGADAVYIGAPAFSARSAANCTIQEIDELVRFAHRYRARVYVALNTLLYDDELTRAEALIHDLYRIGVDALIVQDYGILRMNLPPIELHSSTQMDNRTAEKVHLHATMGFNQIVLARELPVNQINQIAQQNPNVRLEVFVHGALCVGISGQCFLSQAIAGRSANRGECAQLCRLPYTLQNLQGKNILREKHLLSTHDLNRSAQLETLCHAGVTSFKIEGRLKELSYVKNVVAYYRQALDRIIHANPEKYHRSSLGSIKLSFDPDPLKSFNRGFTSFQNNRNTLSIDTPKAKGEPIGRVKTVNQNHLIIAGTESIHNGDGLCYISPQGKLVGFRVNIAEENRIFPNEMPTIAPKTELFRNHNHRFEQALLKPTAERKISVTIDINELPFGFALTAIAETGIQVSLAKTCDKTQARNSQADTLRAQLTKTGDTEFLVQTVNINFTSDYFLPASTWSNWRRELIELLRTAIAQPTYQTQPHTQSRSTIPPTIDPEELYASNHLARIQLQNAGLHNPNVAFELQPTADKILLRSKHCIRQTLGTCSRTPEGSDETLILLNGQTRLEAKFDCTRCEMTIHRVQSEPTTTEPQ